MRYQVEYGAHSDVVSVHLVLPHRLSSQTYSFTLADADQATGEHAGLIKELLEVEGASEIFIKTYTITMHKSPAFAWDVVLWGMLMVLAQHFGPLEELAPPIINPPDPDCPAPPTPSTAVKH